MYSRRDLGLRYPHVPGNYSGNAFREEAPPAPSEPAELLEVKELSSEEPISVESAPSVEASRLFHFGNGNGIGTEELLLLGLVLLLSQNEKQDDLLPLLLLLLLFR